MMGESRNGRPPQTPRKSKAPPQTRKREEKDRLASTTAASTSSGFNGPAVRMRHAAVKWLSSPHGLPSGVWTGHRKPQDSGSSLRTVVVRSSAKYAPRWMERKWERYLGAGFCGGGKGEGRKARAKGERERRCEGEKK